MTALRGFRFLQVGDGPVERRAGTLLALLGAEVVAVLDDRAARGVLHDAAAVHRAGRSVLIGDPGVAGGIACSGIVDGSGHLASCSTTVDVSGLPTGRAGWAASGAMALTGLAHGPAQQAPGDQAAGLHAAAATLALLTALGGCRVDIDGPALAGERAALLGLRRHGSISPGGSCRLLTALDGWVAVNLPRRSDLDLVEAWLGTPRGADPWATVERVVAEQPTATVIAAGRELGLAVTPAASPAATANDPQARARGQSFPMAPFVVDDHVPVLEPARLVASTEDLDPRLRSPHLLEGRRIVDFSSLWAGPLAASLLAQAGADVVKVESTTRPDGARSGEPRFFALVNARKRSVAVDFTAPAAAEQLAALIDGAAMVLEASRPRAFEQLGLDPTDWRRRHPAGTWVSITAHGRTGPGRQWSGFGDDAAVAGGLVIEVPGKAPLLCADAYADPATGLHAAAVAAAGLVGVGGSFDVALREVVNHLLAEHTDGGANDEAADAADVRVAAPRARASLGPAPRLGADNAAVLGPMRPTSGGSRQTTTPPTPILERP